MLSGRPTSRQEVSQWGKQGGSQREEKLGLITCQTLIKAKGCYYEKSELIMRSSRGKLSSLAIHP